MNDAFAFDDTAPPLPPVEPEPGECCGSGCEPCVYDRYWDAMVRYEEARKAWERRRADNAPQAAVHPGDPKPVSQQSEPRLTKAGPGT